MLADSLEGVRSVGAVEMMSIYGRPRLRGTAALQASIDQRCDERMAIAGRFPGGRPLRRRRENDANLRPATAARDRSSRPPPIIVAMNEWPSLADSLEGVRSVGAVKMMAIYGRPRLRGTAALQAATDHRCDEGMAIAGDSLEGVRSVGAVKMMPIHGRPRLRGTAALQASIDHRCDERMGHC